MVVDDDKSHRNMMDRLFHNALVSTPRAKRQGGEKGKTV
jgi:hypothetical protein